MEINATLDLASVEVMDILPVLAAFVLGFAARMVGLPPTTISGRAPVPGAW